MITLGPFSKLRNPIKLEFYALSSYNDCFIVIKIFLQKER